MPNGFDSIFGIHEQALQVRSKRAQLIANNIANADTPGYKARDIEFSEVLLKQMRGSSMSPSMRSTDARHVNNLIDSTAMEGLKYRNPMQPSIDGNTVDMNIEKAEYAENTLRFQATFTFLNGRVKGILGALRGE